MSLWNGKFLFRVSDVTGKLQQFRVWSEDEEYVTESGNVGGALTFNVRGIERCKKNRTKSQEAKARAKAINKTKRKAGWKSRDELW